jgi:fructose-1,6-bisphosphatase-3
METEANAKHNKLTQKDLRYLKLLSKQYPGIDSACNEIINLKAILGLPKGTEHFITDIHGEYEQFIHILKNASGVIKRKIDDIFGDKLTTKEKKRLATLIYYPEQKLELIQEEEADIDEWYKATLYRLIELCRVVSSKYTRSQVRQAIPTDFAHIIEELLHESESRLNKEEYYQGIIQTIIELEKGREFIITLSNLIQRLSVYRLHIIGDIFDRGPGADIIMDRLIEHHSVDIQWGNHDIVWMGAGAGSEACMATCLRLSLRYSNLKIVEEGYGINLVPLATLAMEVYVDDPCEQFLPRLSPDEDYTRRELNLMKRMHKAISIIQFKLEGQIIKRRVQYAMEDRLLLERIDFEKGKVEIDGKSYPLNDTHFPTIDPQDPYRLTEQEKEVVDKLKASFKNSEKLQKHVRFLFAKGSLYLVYNSNLLFHGCIILDKEGGFANIEVDGKKCMGKEFMDRVDKLAREGYFSKDPDRRLYGQDTLWYLWGGSDSPLFGKTKMTTFERYFIDDEQTHIEVKNPYYDYRDDEETAKMILAEFGLDPNTSHIINGHVPVKAKKGESPIKANGRLLVIDGGFAKAYHSKTGIAGYTLIYNSYGMILAAHEAFESTRKAIEEEKDILPDTITLEEVSKRKRVGDTDRGKDIKLQIEDLKHLVEAYREGLIK